MSRVGDLVALDAARAEPLFEQVRAAVLAGVRDGRLPAGTKLPPVRELAAELEVAPHTVARAYRELEGVGVVETRGRGGTVVAATDPTDAALSAAAGVYADAVRSLGVDRAAAVRYLDAALGR